jgi:hypothetical protein
LFTSTLKPSAIDLPKSKAYLPSNVANYFLGLEGARATLYAAGNSSPLVSIGELKEFQTGDARTGMQNDFIWDKRIQLIPAADLLISLPPGKDQIVLRRLNVMDLLKKSGLDYLFVDSLPVVDATKGRPYLYELSVQSRKGGLKYELSSGPEGMTLSRDGRLTWDPPVDLAETDVTPVLVVKDANGQEIFHTFTIHVH